MMTLWSDPCTAGVSDPSYSNGQNIAVNTLNVRTPRELDTAPLGDAAAKGRLTDLIRR